MEPFSAFQSYSTAQIDEKTKLTRRFDISPEQADDILNLKSFTLGKRLLPSDYNLIDFLSKIPVDEVITTQELIHKTGLPINVMTRLVMVCLKLGVLSVNHG